MNEFEKTGSIGGLSSENENNELVESESENSLYFGEPESENTISDEEAERILARRKKEKSPARTIYEYVETFCYALAVMMILFLFVFRYVSVDGHSMNSTLHHKDKLIISDLFYEPKTGDIVVINPESHGTHNSPIIKRVIATEGQKVYIDYVNWEVYVDGKKLDEPYIQPMREEMQKLYGNDVEMRVADNMKYVGEFTVGKNKIFVMGDNRNNSKDSRAREYGEMNENRIIGRVILRLAPDFGTVD